MFSPLALLFHSVWMLSRSVPLHGETPENKEADPNQTKYLTELLVSWIMLLVSLALCAFVLYHTRESNYEVEQVVRVEDVGSSEIHGAALPKGHHVDAADTHGGIEQIEEKKQIDHGELVHSV